MNEIVIKFLLAEDKFIPEMHLRQPGFTYSTCGPFTKNKERIRKFKETGDPRYINQNELDKACFQHYMGYGDFKDLTRRTASDKMLRDKRFNIAKIPKCDGLASMVYEFFVKKTSGGTVKNEISSNEELAEELHKSIIRKFKKRKIHSPFIDNIWGADLADMQLISNSIKDLYFHYVLFIFVANMHGLFLSKIKKEL